MRVHGCGEMEEEHNTKRKSMEEDIEYVMAQYLVRISHTLNEWKHYTSLITVGNKAQPLIKSLISKDS